VEYSITEYGKGISPVLQVLNDWGVAHMSHMERRSGDEWPTPEDE